MNAAMLLAYAAFEIIMLSEYSEVCTILLGVVNAKKFKTSSKCLSYKTIEEPVGEADKERTNEQSEKWVFGCDDCMNACPWNRFNKTGWKEFSANREFLAGLTRENWEEMTEDFFREKFKDTPLSRDGLEKIRQNISR